MCHTIMTKVLIYYLFLSSLREFTHTLFQSWQWMLFDYGLISTRELKPSGKLPLICNFLVEFYIVEL